jgi:hypothetical protein
MRVVALVLVVTLFGAVVALAVRQAGVLRSAAGPARLPAGVARLDGRPSAWIFVREGCPHCESHLQALVRGALGLEPALRSAALARVRVIGSRRPPSGTCPLPDTLRAALGVRLVPTTWLVRADGTLRESWRGARNEDAWRRAFAFLLAEPEVP